MAKILIISLYSLPPLYFLYLVSVYFFAKVPFIVTPKNYLSVLFDSVNIPAESIVYDLGCGKGDFMFGAEKCHPKKIIGYELSPLHVLYIRLKAIILKSKVEVHFGDFMKADISEADIIYLFLVPTMIAKTWEKISKEGKRGALVITLCDSIPDVKFIKCLKTDPKNKNSTNFYLYQVS